MSPFTWYVRALGRGEDAERELPRVWQALRDALRSELKRRGLWDQPPSYFGLTGWKSWSAVGERHATFMREDALNELTAECYSFIFIDRLPSLAAQLRVKPDIEGLVFLDVRHFLHERQRSHDPLGFRIFEVARRAVRELLGAGEIHLLAGDPRILNETALGFSPRAILARGPAPNLQALADRWNDEILPSLGSHGKWQHEAVGKLRRRLPELRAEGIEAFLFRELVDPLKYDARLRWAGLLQQSAFDIPWAEGQDEAGAPRRIALPDARAEESESFNHLVRGVAESLGRLNTDERTRSYLRRLWDYLSRWASEPVDFADRSSRASDSQMKRARKTDRPSQHEIARQLDIPRERLRGLFEILKSLVAERGATALGPRPRPSKEV
jgi:hypothetical protein